MTSRVSKDEGRLLSSYRPIELMLDNILHSRFYQFLLRLPKGGNLHLHESQTLSRRIFLVAIRDPPEFDLLHICDHPDCQKKRFVLEYSMLETFSNALVNGSSTSLKNWNHPKKKSLTFDLINNQTSHMIRVTKYSKESISSMNPSSRYSSDRHSLYRSAVDHHSYPSNSLRTILTNSYPYTNNIATRSSLSTGGYPQCSSSIPPSDPYRWISIDVFFLQWLLSINEFFSLILDDMIIEPICWRWFSFIDNLIE